MSGRLLIAEHDGRRFEIIADDPLGYYLFCYDGLGPRTTHDYLDDTVEDAKQRALEDFAVPIGSWRATGDSEPPAYTSVSNE